MALADKLSEEIVERELDKLVSDRIVDGISAGYIHGKDYGIVHAGTAGKSGVANNLTVYEIGSVSKIFTSLLLADAVVRGEIELDTAAIVSHSNVQLPAKEGRPIRWIDLSTHRSALPRLPSNMNLTDLRNPYQNYDSKKAATFLDLYDLPRKPGESQEYSNFAVSLLGYLVAQNEGKSYEELLKERIAKPLRMTDCTISLDKDQKRRLATPHSAYGTKATPWTFADLPGAGGIRATMRDMMRFARAQLHPPKGKLGEAIELAWKQHTDADDSGAPMGLGWMIAGDGQTRWHNGQTGGYHASLFVNREINCAVVLLCNTAVFDKIDELAINLIRHAAGTRDLESEPHEKKDDEKVAHGIDAKHRARLEGRYRLTKNFIFTVRDRDGRMMVSITNQPTQEVFPDSPSRWSYRGVAATLEFKLPKAGPAKSLVLHQNGMRKTARRIK